MKIKDVVTLFESPSGIDSDTMDHAMWWVQRWVSGSMRDPEWEEGESVNKLTVHEAFSIIQRVIGSKEYTGTMLWRYLSVDDTEMARIEKERSILPNNSNMFQSFTTSFELAAKIAEEFGSKGGKEEGVIVGCRPSPDNIMFGMKALFSSNKLKHWTLALGDWEWQDEVLVRVVQPLPIKDMHIVTKR